MDMPAPLSHTAHTVRMMPPAQTSKSNGSKRHGGGHTASRTAKRPNVVKRIEPYSDFVVSNTSRSIASMRL